MSSGSHNAKVFINYRREDTAPYAGRLYDRLTAHFGTAQVFIDIDHIEPGEDFVEAINTRVGACEVAIVSIGPNWLRATDASGKRRLDDTEDFVRMEIVAALQRKIRVIPVLMGGARMPRKQDLPEALEALSRRNAIELSETRFHADVDRLIEAIEKPRAFPEKTAGPSAAVAPVAAPERSAVSPDRTAFYRWALIATGIALVAGCLVWALTMRRSPDVVLTEPEPAVMNPVVPGSDSETVPPSPNPGSEEASAAAALDSPVQEDRGSGLISDLISGKSAGSKVSLEEDWIQKVRKRAGGGAADAQFEMGAFYEFGFGTLLADSRKAAEWYQKAARQGHVLAKEGLEDLSRSGAALSEFDAAKLEARRGSRYQKGSSSFLDEMNAKAQDAIKKIKE